MRRLLHFAAVALVAAALPYAALADVTGTPTVPAGVALNLDTGAMANSGGDILWSGSVLSFQSNATGFNFGSGGASVYAGLTQSTLSLASAAFSKSVLPAALLTVGTIIGVHTNGGNYAKVLVTSASGTSLGLQFTTFGASTTPTGPTVTAIQNNYSYIAAGLPNYGIAPSSLFIVKGTGLADPGAAAVLQSSAKPGIPLTLNGASVSVTVNGVTTHPGFYYALATQLALVLPAGTPIGDGTLTVTYNNATSQPAPIKVVPVALGIGTYNGLAIATDYTTYSLYTYTRSIKPGDTIVLWGSGLGAVPADSDTTYTATPHQGPGPLQVYIGGIQATVTYQADSGYPGVNQVNVVVPASVLPGCNVSLVALSGDITCYCVSIPVAAGGGVCSDAAFGTNGTTQQTIAGQTTVRTGLVALLHSVAPEGTSDIAEAVFQSNTGAASSAGGTNASLGSCSVLQTVTAGSVTNTSVGLDAGSITVSGPAGSATLSGLPTVPGFYVASSLAPGFIPTSGGAFTFRGTGGTNVGSFSTTLNFPNPLLTWTNTPANATINRTSGATITWTGGAAGSYVLITGSSSSTAAGSTATGSYYCFAPVSAGQFTVPPSVLLSLPAGTGSTMVENATNYQTFTATGIDYGFAFGGVSQSINTTYN